jgi:hypothetical protein
MSDHEYGFLWGPMNVSRLMTYRRGKRENSVLGVFTEHHRVEINVSRTGRSVRVWVDGKELK